MRFHLLWCVAPIFAAQAWAEDLEFKIPPVTASLDVKGQAVKITAWGTVSSGAQGPFRLALTADLSELQDNIGALLASQLNRSDRCGERLSVESATLSPASPAAILTGHLRYERWACAKAFGREMVKRLVGGNAVITVKLTPSAGSEGIGMASEVQKIDADGSLGELLRSGSLGTTVKEKIASSIESSIRKGLDLKSALPPEAAAAATLGSARFASGREGRLWFSVDANFWYGGATSLNGAENSSTTQKNSRLGATASIPLSKHQSLKFNYSAGAYVRFGGDYQSVSAAWQYFWVRESPTGR